MCIVCTCVVSILADYQCLCDFWASLSQHPGGLTSLLRTAPEDVMYFQARCDKHSTTGQHVPQLVSYLGPCRDAGWVSVFLGAFYVVNTFYKTLVFFVNACWCLSAYFVYFHCTQYYPLSSELLLLHRLLFEELSQLPSLPEAVQVDKLLELLERTFSAFSVYNSFMDNSRPQAVQVSS